MKKMILILLVSILAFTGCKQSQLVPSMAVREIYIPNELKDNDFSKSTSKWYSGRSRQSDHFIVFWDTKYGDQDPNSTTIPEAYRVDIDDLLIKSEQFYELNINQLRFAEVGSGKSNLDKYKMLIFIFYQDEWMATGSGYDDVIGALWISPATCKPVGAVIAHEIGHSFQYQVYCDLKGGSGFRYGFGGNGGNGFWEQTAQWQAFQSYPQEAFTSYNFKVYTENYHRHIHHESYRYASYFMHSYWTNKHGLDMIGKVWRQAQKPEDPIQAYMRLTKISVEQLNNEIFDAATKFVTWDIDAIRTQGLNYIGAQTYKYKKGVDGSYQVTYDRCPGTTGYNVIPLTVPTAGTVVSAAFTGLINEPGFNPMNDPGKAGWRYGYVALQENGNRVYGTMNQGSNNSVAFTVPDKCSKLWFVVTGAPSAYTPNPWDDNEANDEQWPYKVKFSNTTILGDISFTGNEVPANITLAYSVRVPHSTTDYTKTEVKLAGDLTKLAQAFVLTPSEITSQMGNKIKFYAIEANGTMNPQTTANGYGHWFNAQGNVTVWGEQARVFAEFDATNFSSQVGLYPGRSTAGNTYTIKQGLEYEYSTGKKVLATMVFTVTVE